MLFQRSLILALALMVNGAMADERAEVAAVLDAYHHAASVADADAYLGKMNDNSVFLGTDATERWSKAEFAKFVGDYFGRGKGWTYKPLQRHIDFSPDGKTAWFDEALHNDKYGQCRGSGVLLRTSDGWKIAQYHLTFPIPNAIAVDVVDLIKVHGQSAK